MKSEIWQATVKYLTAVVVANSSLAIYAQDVAYPTKPIELIVPFGPGATSTGNFLIAKVMGEHLKQPVVVINKAGAGGALGSAQVVNAKPDGYTLLAAVPAFVTLTLTEKKLAYKVEDFMPVAQFARFNHYLVVHKDSPAKSLPELMASMKSRTPAGSYAGTGIGGTAYLLIESLKLGRKMKDPLFVPYQSEAGAVQAVMSGDIQFAVVSAITAVGMIQQGSVRALAVFSSQRDPVLPQVPTATEQGYPELVSTGYLSLVAPAKTPAYVVRTLESVVEKAVTDKQLQEGLLRIGASAHFRNSSELGALFRNEQKVWGEMGKRVGIEK